MLTGNIIIHISIYARNFFMIIIYEDLKYT